MKKKVIVNKNWQRGKAREWAEKERVDESSEAAPEIGRKYENC